MAINRRFEKNIQREFISQDEVSKTPASVDAIYRLKSIEGYLEKIVYSKGAWSIITIKGKDNNEKERDYRCIGNMNERIEGAYYKLQGTFKFDKYNNNQYSFYFDKYEVAHNNDERGIIAYLSLEVPHIGEALAKKLYSVFGAQTLIRATDAEALMAALPNLNEEAAREIARFVNDNSKLKDLKRRLYGIGLTPGLVNRMIAHYGYDKPIEKLVREDCFSLTEIAGVGFATVSKIADLLGIPKTDPNRIKAAVVYAMAELEESEGHTCIEKDALISKAGKLLGFYHDGIEEQVEIASQNGYLMCFGTRYSIQYLIDQELKGESEQQPESGKREFDESEINDILRSEKYNPTTARVSRENVSRKGFDSFKRREKENDLTREEPDLPMSGSEEWDLPF